MFTRLMLFEMPKAALFIASLRLAFNFTAPHTIIGYTHTGDAKLAILRCPPDLPI